jgi:8-oxo-dGTP pyrophosphatase MutT (NUDIX family)
MPTSTTPNTAGLEAFPQHSPEEIEARLAVLAAAEAGHSQRDQNLRRFPFRRFMGSPQSAAVLLPLLKINDAWHLLFIRRSVVKGDAHSGQVAFPGGRCEGNETYAQAALREAHEEVGLLPQDVRLLGSLKPMHSITNYTVTPVVGVIPWPYPIQLETREVSRAFTIPLDWLANPANRSEKPLFSFFLLAALRVTYFEPYDGETLWGLTARFTLDFLDVYLA